MNSKPKRVLPLPTKPCTRIELPLGIPPRRMLSRPSMPVRTKSFTAIYRSFSRISYLKHDGSRNGADCSMVRWQDGALSLSSYVRPNIKSSHPELTTVLGNPPVRPCKRSAFEYLFAGSVTTGKFDPPSGSSRNRYRPPENRTQAGFQLFPSESARR